MAAVLGGVGSEQYEEFERHACAAYGVLRRKGRLLLTMLSLMTACGIPELESAKDIDFLRERLDIDLTDEQADARMRGAIKESLDSMKTIMNDAVHLAAHTK